MAVRIYNIVHDGCGNVVTCCGTEHTDSRQQQTTTADRQETDKRWESHKLLRIYKLTKRTESYLYYPVVFYQIIHPTCSRMLIHDWLSLL